MKKSLLLFLLFFLTSCTQSVFTQQIIIGHSGIDFSLGNGAKNDCSSYSIASNIKDGFSGDFTPTSYLSGESKGTGIWYHSDVSSLQFYYLQNLGTVDLDSITTINDSAWPSKSAATKSLQIDNSYVTKTKDGYAKFKVMSIDMSCPNGLVKVAYIWSLYSTFK